MSRTDRRRAGSALFALVAALALSGPAMAQNGVDPGTLNDFPTAARADYVFGCMAANGQTRDALMRCSCSVDVVASILPYDKYEQAETILMMRQGVGQAASTFRSNTAMDETIADLRRAQAEAEMRCFP